MTDKKTELRERYNIIALEFAAKIREETIKAGLGKVPKAIIEYFFKKLDPVLDEIADKLAHKAETWIKKNARKAREWLKRKWRKIF